MQPVKQMIIKNDEIHDILDNYIRMAEIMDSPSQLEDMKKVKKYIDELEYKLLLVSIKEQIKG